MTAPIADSPRSAGKLGWQRILARADVMLTGWRLFAVVAGVYLVYALFVTWPLATNLPGQLSAPNLLEDAAGTTSYFANLATHHLGPFSPAHLAVQNAPQGLPITWALNLAQAPSYLLTWVLVLIFGAVAGSNIFMLLGFVLSGVTMFAIVRRLFGSRSVALLAGFAFAFYPFAVAASSVHYAFVHGWPLLLGVWALIEMIHRPSRRSALLAGVATAFAMWWNPYYELLGGFTLITCLMVCVAVGHVRRQTGAALRACATALVPVGALGLFFIVLLKAGGGIAAVGTTARPISQVYIYSAHLRDYLPGPYSLLFGRLTGPYLIAHLGVDDTWDTALYPGYTVLLLAIAGFTLAARRLRTSSAALTDRRVVAVLTAAILAVVAFVSSGPPTISLLGLVVRMPSDLLFHITPTWQTFARFVILLEPALILMMAAALAHLRHTLRGPRAWSVLAIVGLLLVVDLWDRQPHRTVSTTPPSAYAWLRAHPGGTVADYPLLPAYDANTGRALFWGASDLHPLFNGWAALSFTESMKLDLADLREPQTAGKLAAYGVRYIVVHRGTPGGQPSELSPQGYRPIIIGHHGPSLWEVESEPAWTSVDAMSGFDWEPGFPSYDTRLLLGRGTLALTARDCRACTGTVTFRVAGQGTAFKLTVRETAAGTTLARRAVPADGSVLVRVPVSLVNGRAQLELQTTPSAHALYAENTARLTVYKR